MSLTDDRFPAHPADDAIAAMQRFVVVSLQRTGSTWLVEMLDSHPQIGCHDELLRRMVPPELPVVALLDPRYRDLDYRFDHWRAYVDDALAAPGKPIAGFKLMAAQHDEALAEILADPAWRVVTLDRPNVLAAWSSHLIVKATGQSILREGEAALAHRPRFESEAFAQFCRMRAKRWTRVQELLKGREHLALTYPELRQAETWPRLLAFLGADPAVALSTDMRKRNDDDIFERFANPEDIDAPEAWRRE